MADSAKWVGIPSAAITINDTLFGGTDSMGYFPFVFRTNTNPFRVCVRATKTGYQDTTVCSWHQLGHVIGIDMRLKKS
jgi:hypothetical protein